MTGTVIAAQIFSREGVERDERAKQIQATETARILLDQDEEMRTLISSAERKLVRILSGQKAAADVTDDGELFIKKGQPFTEKLVQSLPISLWQEISVASGQVAHR